MREIKFRVWDNEVNSFIGVGLNVNECNFCDGVIFQQYTCLKDKNGAEIYEGDILKIYFRQLGIRGENGQFISMVGNGLEEYFFREDIVEVKFKIDKMSISFCLLDYLSKHFMADKNSLTCEVIGNIFENKDLL